MTTTWTNNIKNLSEVEALYDSYSETNLSSYEPVANGTEIALGQSFVGNGGILTTVKFYLKKNSTPTGNVSAKLYAHTGTFGTTGKPTGSALETSSTIDITTIGTSADWYTFTFSGEYVLVDGTYYVIVVYFPNGAFDFFGGDDYLQVALDTSSPTHAGIASYSGDLSSWTILTGADLVFELYTRESTLTPYSNQSKNSTTYSNETKPLEGGVTATAGMGMGLLLALSYSGGEILATGGPTTWTSLSKN